MPLPRLLLRAAEAERPATAGRRNRRCTRRRPAPAPPGTVTRRWCSHGARSWRKHPAGQIDCRANEEEQRNKSSERPRGCLLAILVQLTAFHRSSLMRVIALSCLSQIQCQWICSLCSTVSITHQGDHQPQQNHQGGVITVLPPRLCWLRPGARLVPCCGSSLASL
jgi:hypothetical protein